MVHLLRDRVMHVRDRVLSTGFLILLEMNKLCSNGEIEAPFYNFLEMLCIYGKLLIAEQLSQKKVSVR